MGMYEDILRAVRAQESGKAGWSSPLESLAYELPQMLSTRRREQNVMNQDRASNLMSLYELINNEEGINSFNAQVSSFAADSAGNKEMLPVITALDTAGRTKKEDFNMFKRGIDDGSNYISSVVFPDTQQEFLDLPKLAEAHGYTNDETGEGLTLEFIFSEKDRVNKMMDGIRRGMGEKGNIKFRYNKNPKHSDSEVYRKLAEYNGRLDVAVSTLGEDGVITPAEAQHILTGNLPAYLDDRKLAAGEAIDNIKTANRNIGIYDTALRNLEKGELNKDDFISLMATGITMEGITTETPTKTTIEILKGKIEKAQRLDKDQRTMNNEKYKAWIGRYYILEKAKSEEEVEAGYGGLNVTEALIKKVTEEKEKEVIREEKKAGLVTPQTGLIGEYNVFTVESGIKSKQDKERKSEIASSLGEKSYVDVKKKYMRVPYNWKDYWLTAKAGQYKASDVKIEDANKDIKTVLDKSNVSIDDMSKALSQAPHDIEARFQKYIDMQYKTGGVKPQETGMEQFGKHLTRGMGAPLSAVKAAIEPNFPTAREILYHISGSKLYQLQKGPIGALLGLGFQAAGAKQYAPEFGGYYVKGMKRISPKEIKKFISSHDNFVPKYEQLLLLYSFLGQELKVGEEGNLIWNDGTLLKKGHIPESPFKQR
jgi:hypothetical protein